MAEEQLRDGVGQWIEDNISVPLWDFLQPDKNADQISEERDNQVRKGLQVQREFNEFQQTDTSFAGEVHKVLVGTIADAVTNVINAADYAGDYAGSILPGRSQTDIPWSNEYQPSNFQSPVAPNNTPAGKMIRDLAALYVNMRQVGATGLGIGGGATLKSRLATEALRGGVVDFLTTGKGQENLSNTIQGTKFANPISQSLAINPEDSDLTARFKSTGEGVLLGLGIDGTQELAGPASKLAIKAGKQIKTDLSVIPEDIDRFIQAIKNSSPPPGSNLELAGIPSLNGGKHLDDNVLKMNKGNNPLVDTGVTRNGEPIFEQRPARTGPEKRIPQADIPEEEWVYITDIPRNVRTKPPRAELIEYAKQHGIPVPFAEKFSDDSIKTFNQQKKAARTATHQTEVDINNQADAGHYLASGTESVQFLADTPGQRLHTPPTHGDTARPQPRIANRLNDPNDHINIHIADSVGVHTTWAKKLQAAWDVENGKYVFNFKADLSLKGQEAMLNIDVNLPRSQAIKARDAILADPSNLANTLSKQDLREFKLEQLRTQIEHYTKPFN